jgi:hypothetical protein
MSCVPLLLGDRLFAAPSYLPCRVGCRGPRRRLSEVAQRVDRQILHEVVQPLRLAQTLR